MKEHFCPAEKSIITYQDKCNWCGERETLAQTQEPVACQYCHNSATLGAVYFDQNCVGCVKRMSHPPQRTWVGLTDEEVELYWDWEDFQCGCGPSTLFAMVRDIEARLKDRNT